MPTDSRRSAQKIAVQYKLPLVRIGHRSFINPQLAADILSKAQLVDREPRGRGRPAAGKTAPGPERAVGSGRIRGGA